MIHNLRNKKLFIEFVPFNSKVVLLQPKSVVKAGIVQRSSSFEAFDISASLAEFHSVDFSIASLESIGALSKLTTTFMSSMSDMNIADKFESIKFEQPNV